MEGHESEEEDFEMNAKLDREPVELLEDGGDVVEGGGSCDHLSSRILEQLKVY